jgi:hypothetical protein
MSKNTLFAIAFGDYDLRIDRNTLRYRLEETATGTVWADGLGVGWIEFEDRLTGGLSRYDFGRATLVALSEKAGPRGKEILFGLECLGVPIDLYFTCAQREIRLTVEANRDGKTHRVTEVCLLPGLCAVPDDGVSHLVIPHHDGLILRPGDLPAESLPFDLPVWDAVRGLAMPFVGAVRVAAARDGGETDGGATTTTSALALGTDSAYAAAWLEPGAAGGGASLDFHYVRDPERRRLELRIWPLPRANHVGVARAHRDKVIATRQHVLLRRKARERPVVDAALLGGALIRLPIREAGAYVQSFADAAEIARDLRRRSRAWSAACVCWKAGPAARRRRCCRPSWAPAVTAGSAKRPTTSGRSAWSPGWLWIMGRAAAAAGALETAREDLPEIRRRFAPGALLLGRIGEEPLRDEPAGAYGRKPAGTTWTGASSGSPSRGKGMSSWEPPAAPTGRRSRPTSARAITGRPVCRSPRRRGFPFRPSSTTIPWRLSRASRSCRARTNDSCAGWCRCHRRRIGSIGRFTSATVAAAGCASTSAAPTRCSGRCTGCASRHS